ncbi:MAG: hypothetical protein RR549_05200 [Oscillospiraceae bacterium]
MFSKKSLIKITAIVMCSCIAISVFSSCNNKSTDDEYNISFVPFETKSSIGSELSISKTNLVSDYDSPKSIIIEDIETLSKFYEENKSILDFTVKSKDYSSFEEVYKNYKEKLQMYKALIITIFNGTDQVDAYKFNGIERKLNRMDVSITKNKTGDNNCTWIFVNEVPRETVSGCEAIYPIIK